MNAYLLDTHVWSWSLVRDLLPTKIADLLLAADELDLSSISFYEIRQKVRIGKWPEMEPYADDLIGKLAAQGTRPIAITAEISDLAGALAWDHRDPFDRIIAATSIHLGLPLISADIAFDELSSLKDWPGRIW